MKTAANTQRPIKPAKHYSETFGVSFVRFSIKEQTLFAKRLSFLIKAGVPLVDGLALIRKQTKERGKGKIFDAVIADVTAGQYLSTSLAKFQNHFGDFTVNLISIGERAGILSQNLMYLSEELAKKHALQRKVRGSLVYPIFITATTLGVTGLLTVFIFPKIMPIFVSLDIDLPLTTRILLWLSTFLSQYGIYVILGAITIFGSFVIAKKNIVWLCAATDRAVLSLPIAGEIARAYNAANFCRTLGILLNSGIHVTEALQITANVTHNLMYRRAIERVANEVMKGDTISKHLALETTLFPDMIPHMVAIGETTGSLVETLRYLAEMYETEVDEKTKNLSNSIEPVLLVTMGLVVGLIAVSVITPVYDITKNLQR